MLYLCPNPFPLLLLWLCLPWIGVFGILWHHLDLWQHRALSLWCGFFSCVFLGYCFLFHPFLSLDLPFDFSLVLDPQRMLLSLVMIFLMTFMLWIHPRGLKFFCCWGFFSFLLTLKSFFWLFLFMEGAFLFFFMRRQKIQEDKDDKKILFFKKITYEHLLWRYGALFSVFLFFMVLTIFDFLVAPKSLFPFLNILVFLFSPFWPFSKKEALSNHRLLFFFLMTGLLWQLSFWIFQRLAQDLYPTFSLGSWSETMDIFTKFSHTTQTSFLYFWVIFGFFLFFLALLVIVHLVFHHGSLLKNNPRKNLDSVLFCLFLKKTTRKICSQEKAICPMDKNLSLWKDPQQKHLHQQEKDDFLFIFLKPWFLCQGLLYIVSTTYGFPIWFLLFVLGNNILLPLLLYQFFLFEDQKDIESHKTTYPWSFYSFLGGILTPYILGFFFLSGFFLYLFFFLMVYLLWLFVSYCPFLMWHQWPLGTKFFLGFNLLALGLGIFFLIL